MHQPFIIVPGINGSGPDHWQSRWQAAMPAAAVRIEPASLDQPDLQDWIDALERAVAAAPRPPVLVCHSLGCLLYLHWRARSARAIRAVVLVAVPDPQGPAFPAGAARFADLPEVNLRDVPVLAIASTDDPYDLLGRGAAWVKARGARLRDLGPRGHLNAASGLGDWPEGWALVTELLAWERV